MFLYVHVDFFTSKDLELHNRLQKIFNLKINDHSYLMRNEPFVEEITVRYAYWRKANHIHKYFVDNFGFKENNTKYDCEYDKLMIFKDVLGDLLSSKSKNLAEKILPRMKGHYFGDQSIDEYSADSLYWNDLEYTFKILNDLENIINIFANTKILYKAHW